MDTALVPGASMSLSATAPTGLLTQNMFATVPTARLALGPNAPTPGVTSAELQQQASMVMRARAPSGLLSTESKDIDVLVRAGLRARMSATFSVRGVLRPVAS